MRKNATAATGDFYDQLKSEGYERLKRAVEEEEPESLHLDFKEWPQHLKEVLGKAASAFANTDGGTIVLGVMAKGEAKDPDAPKKVYGLNPIADLKKAHRKVNDAFGDLLNPPVPGVEVKAFKDPLDHSRGAIAIRVPAGQRKPHQATCQFCYFGRTTSNSVRLPDALVRALVLAQQTPALVLKGRVSDVSEHGTRRLKAHQFGPSTYEVRNYQLQIELSLSNEGSVLAKNIAIAVEAKDVRIQGLGPLSQVNHVDTVVRDARRGENVNAHLYQLRSDQVLYPGTSTLLLRVSHEFHRVTDDHPPRMAEPLLIRIWAFAEGATKQLDAAYEPGELAVRLKY
jgi:hypothetical protein